MEKQFKLFGIMAIIAIMAIMSACDLETLGMEKKPDIFGGLIQDDFTRDDFIDDGEGLGSGEVSNNANIRAVSGEGANALYGLYIAGSPGISNGTPQADVSGFEANDLTVWGNYTLSDPANNRSIVVIVEDKKVSKVEFGITANATAAPTSVTVPDSWVALTKNNEYTTPDTNGKRWTGTLTSPDRPSASSYREVYVRITAQDGETKQVYRYVQYVSSTAPSGNNAARGELNALTIGGVSVVTNAKDAGTNKKGTYAGWWNKTTAPEIEAGEVTLTSAQAANGAINATFCYSNEQAGSIVSYAKIPAAEWPLKESAVAFTELTTTTSSNIVASGTISGITNGDYIIIRRNPPTSATYSGYYGHYIIKVNVEVPSYTVTFDKNGGTAEASPANIKVTPPATTVVNLPTAPTRTGYSFTGWNTIANGSGSAFTATTTVTADITVYAQWFSDSPVVLSSNANIRAVSGTGASALYGLYIGGMPGISNGTARSDTSGFTSTTITLSGNNPSMQIDRKAVVIVEDANVSKVEFALTGFTTTSGTVTINSSNINLTGTPTWTSMTKDNDYTTPDTVDKRWTAAIGGTIPSSSSYRAIYVRITAQDNTVQVYRYVQYISTTVTTNVTRGELSALSIGGVAVITSGAVQSGQSKGIALGWWNRTVAPDLEPGSVTITAAQAASCAVSATVNQTTAGFNVSIAKISASQWPLLENSGLTFGYTGSNGTTTTGSTKGETTFTNVQNGDYIIIRQNAATSDATYGGLFTHTIIKVTVSN